MYGNVSWNLTLGDWWGLLFLGIFGTLIDHGLWVKLSSELSPSITGIAYYSIAPMTIVLSTLFLGPLLSINGAL
jgi:drug/metabolite transporter (DMT)-like permease